MKDEAEKQVIQSAIDDLDSYKGQNIEASELHFHLFNEDYFIIGTYQAKEFLNKVDGGVFSAIELIKNYEQDNFGEVTTDLSDPEKVANMYAYIKGEEYLNDCQTLSDRMFKDETLSDLDLDRIAKELKAQL